MWPLKPATKGKLHALSKQACRMSSKIIGHILPKFLKVPIPAPEEGHTPDCNVCANCSMTYGMEEGCDNNAGLMVCEYHHHREHGQPKHTSGSMANCLKRSIGRF